MFKYLTKIKDGQYAQMVGKEVVVCDEHLEEISGEVESLIDLRATDDGGEPCVICEAEQVCPQRHEASLDPLEERRRMTLDFALGLNEQITERNVVAIMRTFRPGMRWTWN